MSLSKLTVTQVINYDNVKEVTVLADGKPYTFELGSQYDLEEFYRLERRGRYGRAFNWLKKNNIRNKTASTGPK